jgi:hypothetical protein
MPVLETQARVDFDWLFQLLVGDDDGALLSTYHKFTGGFWAVLEGGGADSHFLAFGVKVGDLEGLHAVFL